MTAPAGRAADRIGRLAGTRVTRCLPIGGAHGASHYRVTLGDGRQLFVKEAADVAGGAALAAEASGLRWLAAAGAVRVPGIEFSDGQLLGLRWIEHSTADRDAAERFGYELARLHSAGSAGFGAPWPGFIASLPLPNDEADSWPQWYASSRLLPYCRLARDAGTLGPADVTLVESVADRIGELAGPPEPPSRIHGDCWSGNVLWSAGSGWLIDPAAHGGHRESDLAMMALFGFPFLRQVVAAYQEVWPLAGGWQARVPMHQLHPLLVHVCLFGAGYRESALAAARAALSA